MTCTPAFASIARAAQGAGAASRALAEIAHGAGATMRKVHVVGTFLRSPDPGRS